MLLNLSLFLRSPFPPNLPPLPTRGLFCLTLVDTPAFWAFLWFVGFCYLANQWQVSKAKDNPLNEGTDAARAAIAFSFFSIFTWVSNHLPSQAPGFGLRPASTAGAPSCSALRPAGLPLRKETATIAREDSHGVMADPGLVQSAHHGSWVGILSPR